MKRDWQEFFKPEDFNTANEGEFKHLGWPQHYMAAKANKLLCEALKEAPEVYASQPLEVWMFRASAAPTHSARLIDMREIKR